MKTHLSKIIICTFLVLLILLSTISFAESKIEPRETNNSAVPTSDDDDILASFETNYELAYSDLYFFDNNVEVSQIVDGNVFAYGQTVNVTGIIHGDLFVMANNLTISEDSIVRGNVFAMANNINISGIVSDVYSMSGTFSLEETGIVSRNIYVMSNSTSLAGQISRDAYINTKELSFIQGSKEIIKGNLNYSSNTEVALEEGVVSGNVNFTKIEENTRSIGDIVWDVVSSLISALIFSLIIVLLFIWFAPNFKDRAYEIVSKKSLKALGIGLLLFFGGILASLILLLFTYGFGSAVGVFLIALIILAYVVSNTIFSISIGELITKKINSEKTSIFVLFTLLIVLAINLIGYIPYIGSPVKFITSMIGLGIICISAYKRKDLTSK